MDIQRTHTHMKAGNDGHGIQGGVEWAGETM